MKISQAPRREPKEPQPTISLERPSLRHSPLTRSTSLKQRPGKLPLAAPTRQQGLRKRRRCRARHLLADFKAQRSPRLARDPLRRLKILKWSVLSTFPGLPAILLRSVRFSLGLPTRLALEVHQLLLKPLSRPLLLVIDLSHRPSKL